MMATLIGLALLLVGAWLFWSGWRSIFLVSRKIRVVLRRRALRDAIIAHFQMGAQFVDLEVLALRLAGEDHQEPLRKLPDARRKPVQQLVNELVLVAAHMSILEPFSETFDFAVDAGGGDVQPEVCAVPGLYMLSPEGRALIGGG